MARSMGSADDPARAGFPAADKVRSIAVRRASVTPRSGDVPDPAAATPRRVRRARRADRRPGRQGRLGGAPTKHGELVERVIKAILERFEPIRQRTEPLLNALDVGRRRDVERAHRRALCLGCPLARADRLRHRLAEERVVEERLRQVGQGLLPTAPQTASARLALIH